MVSNVLNKNCEHWLLGDALQFVIIKIHEFCNYVVDVVVLDNMADPKANVWDAKFKKFNNSHEMPNVESFSTFPFFFCMGLIRKGLIIC